MRHKILFLYTEIAGYTLACLRTLASEGVAVELVRYPVNNEAPFDFGTTETIAIHKRNELDLPGLRSLVRRISPSLIVCSGWRDREYLSVCREYFGKIPTVLALDNQWKGTAKQRLAALLSPVFLKNKFSHCWVPGEAQAAYARRLGFPQQNILRGFYSCDFEHFHSLYHATHEKKAAAFPHRFIYVGRYYAFKGIQEMWQAFTELKEEAKNDWELWCMGTGDIEPVSHPAIRHVGFVQPAGMKEYIEQAGVFILPSRFEPWGVALHEFAAAGFPLLCSDEVGAGEAFVKETENGFIFKAGNKEELKQAMKKIMALPDEKLVKMGERSAALAATITPGKWAQTILKLVNN